MLGKRREHGENAPMPEPMNGSQSDRAPEALRDDWLACLGDLVRNIKRWAEQSGWKTREITKSMKDSVLGEYRAPALLMQRETVEVILNPVSRFVTGADGAVDLYLIPAYDDIASLYFIDGEWKLHYVFDDASTVANVSEPEVMTLSEDAVIRVLDGLVAHAA
jgi:hypothetical protein